MKTSRIWCQDVKSIEHFKIPRQYFQTERNVEEIEVHLFCDDSDQAFSAVIYV